MAQFGSLFHFCANIEGWGPRVGEQEFAHQPVRPWSGRVANLIYWLIKIAARAQGGEAFCVPKGYNCMLRSTDFRGAGSGNLRAHQPQTVLLRSQLDVDWKWKLSQIICLELSLDHTRNAEFRNQQFQIVHCTLYVFKIEFLSTCSDHSLNLNHLPCCINDYLAVQHQ